jgi:hypothetical protein
LKFKSHLKPLIVRKPRQKFQLTSAVQQDSKDLTIPEYMSRYIPVHIYVGSHFDKGAFVFFFFPKRLPAFFIIIFMSMYTDYTILFSKFIILIEFFQYIFIALYKKSNLFPFFM